MMLVGCPTSEDMRQYLAGSLPPKKAGALSGHLESCPVCREALSAMDAADDTLIARLRQPDRLAPYQGEEQCQAALERAKQMVRSPGPAPAGDAFDPYHRWLGIPPADRPAHHYRLLGLNLFESDQDVIRDAAERQMGHVRQYQLGPHLRHSQRLLNELAQAKACLSDPRAKADYDRRLRAKLASRSVETEAHRPNRLGEYKLVAKLGEGGVGKVYRAVHGRLGRTVAIKVLGARFSGDPRAIARFEREMKAVGQLNHPNIVHALDAREIDGKHFLVMEFVDGLSLSQIVDRRGPLPLAEACELIRQAAIGLDYIHQNGLVHRDIKPSNLVLSRRGQVKILDLGLALWKADAGGHELTSSEQAMGTADYMAPEQASDSHNVDMRADVYSLGCTLYKLLCGQPPFAAPRYQGALDKLCAHRFDAPEPIRNLRPEVPRELAAVLERMLAKNPAKRPTMVEVADAVGPLAVTSDVVGLLTEPGADRPAPVAPPRSRAFPPQWFPPRRMAVAAGAAGVVFLGILILIRHPDGRQTRIEVPTGSQVEIARSGELTVTLPEQPAAQAATAKPAPEKPPETGPARAPAGEKPVAHGTASETPAADKPPVEQPAVERPAVEAPPIPEPAVEKPPLEHAPLEKPALETPAAEMRPATPTPAAADDTLDEVQRLYAAWTDETFAFLSQWQGVPGLADKEEKWIADLAGSRDEVMAALCGLTEIRSRKAVGGLLKIAAERREKDNRERWMAVRALGLIGDDSVVPELVHLLYHYNSNTRFWAQISLVRLTGQNFGRDVEAWRQWWNNAGRKPAVSAERISWTTRADLADPKRQEQSDREWAERHQARRATAVDAKAPRPGVAARGSGAAGADPLLAAGSIVEGAGWGPFRVGATRLQLINAMGPPDAGSDARWMKWTRRHIHCLVDDSRGAFELRFDSGFGRPLSTGVRIGSPEKDVLSAYGMPNQTLNKGQSKKLVYDRRGVLFWLKDGAVMQIVVFRPQMSARGPNRR